MLKNIVFLALIAQTIISPSSAANDRGTGSSKTGEGPTDVFMKPILYLTALVLIVILIGVVGFIGSMGSEKDPLIYSKFLTVRKKNN